MAASEAPASPGDAERLIHRLGEAQALCAHYLSRSEVPELGQTTGSLAAPICAGEPRRPELLAKQIVRKPGHVLPEELQRPRVIAQSGMDPPQALVGQDPEPEVV